MGFRSNITPGSHAASFPVPFPPTGRSGAAAPAPPLEPNATTLALLPDFYYKLNDPFSGAPNFIDLGAGLDDGTAENLDEPDYQIVGPNIGGLIPLAANLSGVEEAIGLPAGGAVLNDVGFAVLGWFKVNAVGAASTFYSEGHNGSVTHMFIRLDSDGKLRFVHRAAGSGHQHQLVSVNAYDDNAWHFFAAIREDATNWSFETDGGTGLSGEHVESDGAIDANSFAIDRRAIGVLRRNVDTSFHVGGLSELAGWKTARTHAQLRTVYVAGGGT